MNCKLVDFHAHAFPDKVAKKAAEHLHSYYNMPLVSDGYVSDLIDRARKANVDKVVMHSTATKPSQVESVNDYIASLKNKYSKIIGFGTIHPEYKNYIDELNRVKRLGLKGIKLHADFQGFKLDSDKIMPIYEHIVKLKLPILFHLGDRNIDNSSPLRLSNVLDKFPDMIAIGAHLGGVFMWQDSYKYLVGRNLYLDTSSTLFELSAEKAADIINKHGEDKILFGTDFPLSDYEQELKRFKKLLISEEQKEKIFYKNAYRLLGIEE